MPEIKDGPASSLFTPLPFKGNCSILDLPLAGNISAEMARAVQFAPHGLNVCMGIPFEIGDILLISDQDVTVTLEPFKARWLVFLHTSDQRPLVPGPGGFTSPMRGEGHLNEKAANYVILYQDGTEKSISIYRRHQIGTFAHRWGEFCFQAVPSQKPHSLRAAHEQPYPDWSKSQMRVFTGDDNPWLNWVWAWENPDPEKTITGVRFEPVTGLTLVSSLTCGNVSEQPLRWQSRRKAVLHLPEDIAFLPNLDETGLLEQVSLDLGQIISARVQPIYPHADWEGSYNNQIPNRIRHQILLEYSSHPEACFHLWNGTTIPVRQVETGQPGFPLQLVPPASQRVTLKVIERLSGKQVSAKLHVHGSQGEYLAPEDRHRIVNTAWFEDYSADYSNQDLHACTYISGETVINLPLGRVYIEISKGFEIRPVRMRFDIFPDTDEIVIELDRVLKWRERGWVTADTHVHFLSPGTALLEGAAEGVNIINLLASQWGELMTNVGDFDGQTTWVSHEAEGEKEYMVRVGTENRQHILGHISLLGYRGRIITPMTTGGPDESAIGDAVSVLLSEWAQQCHKQGGLVVLPHFPDPRAEHAASIVNGDVDALEMTSWENLYLGIDPYSLSDWYRYLNCGYFMAAVGGTDKMSANTAVGTVRTYAHLNIDQPFTYEAWMEAVKRAETFVTYGPLLEFFVNGRPMGSRIFLPSGGGSLDVTWQVASVTVPMTRVELVVNGEIRESQVVESQNASGTWTVQAEHSCWMALLVRGHYPDKPEIIVAHSSPVAIDVAGSTLMAAADAVTILEQIEGALAYLDTIGTRAEDRVYKRMRLVLVSAHRSVHLRLHQMGIYHDHDPLSDHPEHD
jgi:hypothetical protein